MILSETKKSCDHNEAENGLQIYEMGKYIESKNSNSRNVASTHQKSLHDKIKGVSMRYQQDYISHIKFSLLLKIKWK